MKTAEEIKEGLKEYFRRDFFVYSSVRGPDELREVLVAELEDQAFSLRFQDLAKVAEIFGTEHLSFEHFDGVRGNDRADSSAFRIVGWP